jgi:hypothetical protein
MHAAGIKNGRALQRRYRESGRWGGKQDKDDDSEASLWHHRPAMTETGGTLLLYRVGREWVTWLPEPLY